MPAWIRLAILLPRSRSRVTTAADRPAFDELCRREQPHAVTQRRDRLRRAVERTDEIPALAALAQEVRVHEPARNQQRVAVIWIRLFDRLVDAYRACLRGEVHATYLPATQRDHLDGGASALQLNSIH